MSYPSELGVIFRPRPTWLRRLRIWWAEQQATHQLGLASYHTDRATRFVRKANRLKGLA